MASIHIFHRNVRYCPNSLLSARSNKSLDASGTSGLVIDNLSITWLSPAASTQPFGVLYHSMKTCPTCYRKYSDDSLAFCLDDGSPLSLSYDSEATRVIPPPTIVS